MCNYVILYAHRFKFNTHVFECTLTINNCWSVSWGLLSFTTLHRIANSTACVLSIFCFFLSLCFSFQVCTGYL